MASWSSTMRALCVLFILALSPVAAEEPPQPLTQYRPVNDDRYVGCFKDTNAFDLDGFLERSQSNSPDRCIATCAAKGFAYAAVQYGESCLCGNSYGRYGAASNCDYPCTGDPTRMCGGFSTNGVYRTGVAAKQEIATPAAAGCGPAQPGLEYGTNRFGGDYKRYSIKPTSCPQTCAKACAADSRCRAWTFVRAGQPSAGCWLKDRVPDATPNPCCDSGKVAQ